MATTPFLELLRLAVFRIDDDRLVVPAVFVDVFFFAADGLEAEVFFDGDFFLGAEAFFVDAFFVVVDFLLVGFLFVVGILSLLVLRSTSSVSKRLRIGCYCTKGAGEKMNKNQRLFCLADYR